MRRAAHQLYDRPPIFEDSLALKILSDEAAARVRGDAEEENRNPWGRGLRIFLAVRSRFAEDELALAVKQGVGQYVVLGAGLDTFAYRNPFPGLQVFEVDYPDTQAWKRQRLHHAGIAIPESMRFAPVDFEHDKLRDSGARNQRSFPGWGWCRISRAMRRSQRCALLPGFRGRAAWSSIT
jgi:methyltransferase (TIGR00027 family)